MADQYDTIAEQYHRFKSTPTGLLEEHNIHAAIQPYVKDAKILDLACGTGLYAKRFIEWGAASVVGVDLSPQMIEIAKQNTPEEQRDRLLFLVGDGSELMIHPEAPFDIVTGFWFLNYAPDVTTMTAMFKNVSQNLKPNGLFVGMTPVLTNDLEDYVKTFDDARNKRFYDSRYLKKWITDGIVEHVELHLDAGVRDASANFDNYHLQMKVYEQAANNGGMKTPFETLPITFPDLKGLVENYWEGYLDAPSFSILRLKKVS